MREQFQTAAEGVGAIVKRFITRSDAIAYAMTIAGGSLAASRLPSDLREEFSHAHLEEGTALKDTRACVSFARAGIAATGTLCLELTDPAERSATALPPIHLAFLQASKIVPDLYALTDTIASLLAAPGSAYLSLTTGPSRTADIERVLTIGVHGPKELHILILEGE